MTVAAFYQWLNRLDYYEIPWPQIKPKLLDDTPLLECFLLSLTDEIQNWIVDSNKEHLPERINQTLKLVELFQTPYTVKAARNFIISLIQRGNRSGVWNLPVPQLSVLTFRQQNPFQTTSMHNYGYYQPLFQAFLHCIPSIHEADTLTREQKIGQALFSALYLGGLARKDLLEALLINAPNYQYCKQYAWVDFIEKEVVYFRWQPDPLSEFLFSKSILGCDLNFNQQDIPKLVTHCIRAYIKTLSMSFDFKGIASLLEAVQIHYHVNMPSAVAYHLINPMRLTPLPKHVWRRYRNIGSLNEDEGRTKEGEVHSDYYEVLPYRTSEPVDLLVSDQRALLNTFRKDAFQHSLSGKKISQQVFICRCHEFLKNNTQHLAQPLFYLVQWLVSMVQGGLKVSSTQTYLSQISGLIDKLSNITFHSIDSQSLLERYNTFIIEKREKGTINNARKIATRIKSFQIFVFLYAGSPEIPFDEIAFYEAESSARVNANLFSEKEISLIKHHLLELDDNLYFVFMLAVRTGIRIGEVLHLQLKHIIGEETDSPLYLIIQTTEYHNTKTASSRRKIPLKKYLSKDEYVEFEAFYRLRKYTLQTLLLPSSDGALTRTKKLNKNFLFTDEANRPLTHIVIYQTIQPLLKQVTRDPKVTFHSLRHTFINNQLLRLFLDNNFLQRDMLKSFSYEVGHLTPEETFKSYFHLMPVVVNHFLNRNLKSVLPLSVSSICRIFGQNSQQYRDKVYKKGRDSENYYNSAISYFRKEALSQYKELHHKQKPGVKKVLKRNDTIWMHPKLFYICITKDLDERFLTKLATVNDRNSDFYLKVHAIKGMLNKQMSAGARGLSWPQGVKEERQLIETYRAIEALSEIKRKKFQTLFSSNRDQKNIIFETDELTEAVKMCKFAMGLQGKGDLLIRLTPSQSQSAISAEEQAEVWLKNLSKHSVAINEVWIKGHKLPIKMVNTSRKHVSGKVTISINDDHNNASHGFKMGIVLALTYLHYFAKK